MDFNKGFLIGMGIIVVVVGAWYIFFSDLGGTDSEGWLDATSRSWYNTGLKDVRTGEMFMLSDFSGEVILFESFAVWCPTCTRQQKEIKKLHEEIGDDVISVSLDIDSNEDESQVLRHTNEQGFNWRFAVSPTALTQGLVDDFGVDIVNAPSAPVVLICRDGRAKQLGSGVKKVPELKEAIALCG
jgi:thiol-disulfide isomerase/thioredoxin